MKYIMDKRETDEKRVISSFIIDFFDSAFPTHG